MGVARRLPGQAVREEGATDGEAPSPGGVQPIWIIVPVRWVSKNYIDPQNAGGILTARIREHGVASELVLSTTRGA
jgi:hypothetical protein